MRSTLYSFAFITLIAATLIGCAGFAAMDGYRKPGYALNKARPVYVEYEAYTDPTFRDMLNTELLRRGLRVLDTPKDPCTVVHVNAKMVGDLVSTATCRVLDSTGAIVLSLTASNPAPGNRMYVGNESTPSIISKWGESLSK